jgi:hypothetical protein
LPHRFGTKLPISGTQRRVAFLDVVESYSIITYTAWRLPRHPSAISPGEGSQAAQSPDGTVIRRSFGDLPLGSDALYDALAIGVYHNAAYNDFGEGRVECFEVEDEIEFAYVLEQAVECLNKDLDQVQEREG